MTDKLLPHRTKNPRWCDQCRHPSIGRLTYARWIWRRVGAQDIYLCTAHADDLRGS